MLRPPLQELDVSVSVVRPHLTQRVLEASGLLCAPLGVCSVLECSRPPLILRVVMLRPPLQELGCSASVLRPPLAQSVLEASARQSSAWTASVSGRL